MSIRTKFNLVLAFLFVLGISLSSWIFYELVQKNARHDVIRNASIMMEAALSMRGYTVQQVKPLLEMQLQRAFLPQSVPAYSATEIFNTLREKNPEYTYKEATLNPTNPRDRATDWEADIIQEFRNNAGTAEIIAERDTPTGRVLYLAHPIKITNKNCLECHSTPDAAPKTMLELYGRSNGFGWKLDEVVGAQIVSVPMSIPIAKAHHTFYLFMGSLLAVFVLIFTVLNLMLNSIVVKPLARVVRVADEVSRGNLEMEELRPTGSDEIQVLIRSFNRLRRSLAKALKMIEDS